MPKSGGDKQNDKNSEHNHSDFYPRNYLHILYHSLRLDKKCDDNYTISINGMNITRVFVTKFLGVHLDFQ